MVNICLSFTKWVFKWECVNETLNPMSKHFVAGVSSCVSITNIQNNTISDSLPGWLGTFLSFSSGLHICALPSLSFDLCLLLCCSLWQCSLVFLLLQSSRGSAPCLRKIPAQKYNRNVDGVGDENFRTHKYTLLILGIIALVIQVISKRDVFITADGVLFLTVETKETSATSHNQHT